MSFVKKFLKINFGLFMLAVGLYCFLLPSKLILGGISGLSMVLTYYFPNIPMSAIMLAINAILLIISFILLGKEFGGYTIYSSLALSGMIYIFEKLFPMDAPFVDNILLNMLFGIIIAAYGVGIIFYENASTGGTDIIAKIINKYTGIEMGKSLVVSDCLIVIAAGITYGVEMGMYSFLGIIINGFVIDNIIAGFNKKMSIFINSEKYKEINEFILKEIDRGTTLYFAEGGYSKKQRVVINSVVDKKEYLKILKFAKEIDKNVFITLNYVNEVHGEGFLKID